MPAASAADGCSFILARKIAEKKKGGKKRGGGGRKENARAVLVGHLLPYFSHIIRFKVP